MELINGEVNLLFFWENRVCLLDNFLPIDISRWNEFVIIIILHVIINSVEWSEEVRNSKKEDNLNYLFIKLKVSFCGE